MAKKPKLLVFASGSNNGGGSGFRNLGIQALKGNLHTTIAGVVSNHAFGGVKKHAYDLGIAFHYMKKPYTAEIYRELVDIFQADFVSLSGWLKLVTGLNPSTTINIHPGPLPEFGGPGLYGHFVHEAVLKAFHKKRITHSAVTMHFVSEEYDRGPIFFRYPVEIKDDDTTETLGARVNAAEHEFQSQITDLIVRKKIILNKDNKVIVPNNYIYL